MRILIIGGTRLSGPFLTRHLMKMGHAVTIFHRGNNLANVPAGVGQIIASKDAGEGEDRLGLRAFADQIRAVRADVVIHMIAFTRADAEIFVEVFRGMAGRAVVAGSSDVYRVMGIINRTEEGERVLVPIDENGPLREKPSLHGIKAEKKDVEQVVFSEPRLPATVLRLPAIYGPGTYRHQEWIRPMLDGRPAIVLGEGMAGFRFSHGYAEDMGWALALAATKEKAAGRIYNVGELEVPTEGERLEDFARVAGWKGRIVLVPDEKAPGGDGLPFPDQDWWLETQRIREELGYKEISDYEAGIRATIEWQRNRPDRDFDLSAVYAEEDRILAGMS